MLPPTLISNFLRNRTRGDITESESSILEAAVTDLRSLQPGQIAVRQDQCASVSTLLVRGFMSRHVDAPDGRRHMVGIHVPGDFVDLHAYALKRLDHDVAALTAVSVAVVPHAALERIQAEHAHLTARLWFSTLLDASIHRQWIYRLSSLDAQGRVAHFLCELNARLLAIGESDGARFELPLTQADIGEACGLTNVHVSRVLRQLREAGLCLVRAGAVHIHDLEGLARAGRFTPGYLFLNARTEALATGQPLENP